MGRTQALAAIVPLVASLISGPPAEARTVVWVPAGTRVGLAFVTPVDSGTAAPGTRVALRVVADVVGGRHVVIRAATPVGGTVTQVTKPGMFGASSRVVIGALRVRAVDGRLIPLHDLVVSKATVSNTRLGAAGASAAGAILLGPVGLLAGALVRGSDVRVPAGTVVVDTTVISANVLAP